MSTRYRQQLEHGESDDWQQDLPRYSEAGSDTETLEEAIDDTLMAQVIPERRRYAIKYRDNFSSSVWVLLSLSWPSLASV